MRRSGFTLLEMILALAIGLVLMISLYSGLLVLSTCKVPVTPVTGSSSRVPVTDNPNDQATSSDLRRISYWMTPQGLAVQELDIATSNDMSSVPPDVPETSYKILASEVK